MQITEQDRESARTAFADEQNRTRMSEREVARLRDIREQDRKLRAAEKKFTAEFTRVPKDTLTLVEVLKRISTDHSQLERRANKLKLALTLGQKPQSTSDVMFWAALTAEQEAMTDEQFIRSIEALLPEPVTRCAVCKGEVKSAKSITCSKPSCKAVQARRMRKIPTQKTRINAA